MGAPWLVCPKPRPEARCRLLCFPFAGGGVGTYRTWWQGLPPEIEVQPVQLPGRDERRSERPFEQLTPLVRALADAVAPALSAPFALFGHSMGALVAFEFARELHRRRAPLPVHLMVSARRAPHLPGAEPPVHRLSDTQLIDRLRRDNGTPEAVLQEPELMAMFLPVIRADFAVNEAETLPAEPLPIAISAFGGQTDKRASAAELDAWRKTTSGEFSMQMFAGGHFFLDTERGALLRSIAERLLPTTRPG